MGPAPLGFAGAHLRQLRLDVSVRFLELVPFVCVCALKGFPFWGRLKGKPKRKIEEFWGGSE